MVDVFQHFGVEKKDFPRRLIGSQTGELLIVGSGRCLWEDTRGLPQHTSVMCVNDAGMYWPGPIKHWYSNDIEQLIHWSLGRRRCLTQLYGTGWKSHSCFTRSGENYRHVNHWPFPGQGSSGLVSIFVAIALGYTNILTVGMPFDNDGHFYDPPIGHCLSGGRRWSNFENETPDRLIQRSLPLFCGKVRALSGRLKEALEPDE